ncbi:hypothetical protein [Butyricicoccus intestinisimiae]|uniref:DZANK-type domain-containing protein n=1 Tax=Butyricicoccus intestinisimiae TaxID=2841509 RepID=A0ABS6EUP8_9FIRM|nr:hypothetical protein [Butyricicoccus intestinisimiae]MBU5491292.1 hypothetical protein [Butyricicoccus intestinisimiae]
MALVKCPECNKEFSEHAECCPNCGCPMSVIEQQKEEEKIMQEPVVQEYAAKFKCEKCGGTEFHLKTIIPYLCGDCSNCGETCTVIRKLTDAEYIVAKRKIQEEIEAKKPHCPFCNSTNLKKIGAGSRLLSVGTLGLAGAKMGKTYHCNNCKANF